MRVIGGNGEALDLYGFTVVPVSFNANLLCHEFGVLPNLPLEVLIGADFLVPHICLYQYLKGNKTRLQFGVAVCASCNRFRNDLVVGSAAQLRVVDRLPRRKRNRLKVAYSFLGTLPEAVCSDSHEMKHV